MNIFDIIVQARTGSSRLPNKVLLQLENKCVLDHVIDRLSKSSKIRYVIISTSTEPRDDVIYNHCNARNTKCFRGSETDVLHRYYETAKCFGSDNIIRVTSDCPLVDPFYIDAMIDKYIEMDLPYIGPKYHGVHNFPDGFNCEIFRFKCLEEAQYNAIETEREHVSTYIINKYSKYEYVYPLCEKYEYLDLDKLHLSLDTIEDYTLMQDIFKNVYIPNPEFTLHDVLQYLNNIK